MEWWRRRSKLTPAYLYKNILLTKELKLYKMLAKSGQKPSLALM